MTAALYRVLELAGLAAMPSTTCGRSGRPAAAVLPSGDYWLRAAAPFEIYHWEQAAGGRRERIYTDACVPLERIKRKQSGE